MLHLWVRFHLLYGISQFGCYSLREAGLHMYSQQEEQQFLHERNLRREITEKMIVTANKLQAESRTIHPATAGRLLTIHAIDLLLLLWKE
jgi:hypothetical protein